MAGYRTEEAVSARKVKPDAFAERIGLGGLYGEEQSRRVKIGVKGHVFEREMHCGVEAGRGRSELMRKNPNQADQKTAQNMAWSNSARFKDVRIRDRKTRRSNGLFSDRARRIPRRTCSRRGVATRGSP